MTNDPGLAVAARSEATPTYPKGAIILALIAIALVSFGGVAVNLLVGERLKIITNSQIEVLQSVQEISFINTQKEEVIDIALVDGDLRRLEQALILQGNLRTTLSRLERAIRLPENRIAFRDAFNVESELRAAEEQQALLIAAGRLQDARALDLDPQRRAFMHQIEQIKQRSQHYVAESGGHIDFWLQLNLMVNLFASLLVGATLFLMIRRTRVWARQLTRMEREARVAAQAKADFLATMSHEIRTPLNGVIGFADLLLDDSELTVEQRRQVGQIQGAGSMLLAVVNDILDFSRLDAEKLELDIAPLAFEGLLDDCISIVGQMAREKNLLMSLDVDPALADRYLGDADRLRQVVLNLLSNAIKFTPAGGVSLSAKVADSVGERDRVIIEVADTGIGIAADRIEQLFQPFTQADSGISKRFGGSGLGLSICRRLIDLMDGTITLKSDPGCGSTFTISLSMVRCDDAVAEQPEHGAAEPGARILVVEDLPMNREIALGMLARSGHSVEVTDSGENAIAMLRDGAFELVLMDIQMAGMDGVETAKRVRALPGAAGRVPILAMTANILPQQVRSYLDAGMNGHVAKPLRQGHLDKAIADALGASQARAEVVDLTQSSDGFDEAAFDRIAAILPLPKLETHLATLSALTREIAKGQLPEAETQAGVHKIGSQAGALGLFRLATAARQLEDCLFNSLPSDLARARFAEAAGDTDLFARPRLEARLAA
ncbi:ATP-binding protein [Erythrobacter alti]|uniref:ATP-binding protein n=1 Tax=Erythrobacter alti TaxID=1896145 RepID=UPI0030F3EED4